MYSYRNKIYHHSVICEIPWQIQKRKDTYIQGVPELANQI
jgi:hypothetical protein